MVFNKLYCFKYKDIFNISNRIKTINKYYELYFNSLNKKFLIVNSAKNNEICLIFDNFNKDIENILKFSKVENSKNIFNFIENENEKNDFQFYDNLKNNISSRLFEFDHFVKRAPDLNHKNIKKYLEDETC